jgi:hypothetical protein
MYIIEQNKFGLRKAMIYFSRAPSQFIKIQNMKKKLLFLFLLAICLQGRSQGDTICSGANGFSNDQTCINSNSQASSDKWFSFVASSATREIVLTLNLPTSGHIEKIELYSGTCTGLNLVNFAQVNPANTSVIVLEEYSLTVGNTYYLRTSRSQGPQGSTSFDLCLSVLADEDVFCSDPSVIPGPLPDLTCDIICNGNFESNWHCPDDISEMSVTYCWNKYIVDPSLGYWECYSPNSGTPDYFNTNFCGTGASVDVPANWAGNQTSHSPGNAYAGFFTFSKLATTSSYVSPTDPGHNYREYLQEKISTPMIPGKKYRFTAYLSLSDNSAVGNYVGVVFSKTPVNVGYATYLNITPDIETPTIIINKTGWDTLTYDYVADSAYKWIILGNFRPDAAGNFSIPDPGLSVSIPTPHNIGYYYIDDVSLVPIDSLIASVSDDTICEGTAITLQAELSIPQELFIQWSSVPFDSTMIGHDTASSLIVVPEVTTDYFLSVTDIYGCEYLDTFHVEVTPIPEFVISGTENSCDQETGPTPYSLDTLYADVTYTWYTTVGYSGIIDSTGTLDDSGIINLSLYPDGGYVVFVGVTPDSCVFRDSIYVGSCCLPPVNPFTHFNNANVTTMTTTSGFGILLGSTFTVNGQTFSINGTFHVNINLDLKGCRVLMGYNAKIIVDPNRTLTIENQGSQESHVYACDEMWDGIYVTGVTTTVVLSNGTTIEDAQNAIVSDNLGRFQVFGNLTNGKVIFNKNHNSIVVKNALTGTHPGFVRSATFQCYDGVPAGSPTMTANKLHFPRTGERSFTGFDIVGAALVNVGDPSLFTSLNTFDNLDFGIRSVNASVSVFNNEFKNITAVPGIPLVKGEECYPGTAICSKGTKLIARTLTVGQATAGLYNTNTFTNCAKGVVGSGFLNIYVFKNTFTNVRLGVRSAGNWTRTINVLENTINQSTAGIDCFENLSATINILNNDINSGGLAGARGIIANETAIGTALYNIRQNTILNVRMGIVGNALKKAIIYQNTVSITHTSTPVLPCYGIRLTASNTCNVIGNGIVGMNSSNVWVEGISLDLCYSDYITCNQTNTLGKGLFFGGVQTPNTYIAKNLMQNNNRGFTLKFAEVGPQFTPGTPNNPNDNRWVGSFVYHTYSDNSNGGLSPIYVRNVSGTAYNPGSSYSFFTTTPGFQVPLNPISGNLNSLMCPLVTLPPPGVPPHMPLLRQIAGDSIIPAAFDEATRWMLKQSLFKYLQSDSTTLVSDTMLSDFQLNQNSGNIGKLDLTEKTIGSVANHGGLMTEQAVNNAISPSNDIEANSKLLNAVLISNILAETSYGDSQLADLRILAAKCPYSDGMAVHHARAILSQFEDTEYSNPCEFSEEFHSMSSVSEINEEQLSSFLLYPNPNDGSMMLLYSMGEKSSGTVFLYDIAGKQIVSYSLQAGANKQLSINESHLRSGIYLYKIVIDDEIKQSNKIVIIK